jgi:hypothetical protein
VKLTKVRLIILLILLVGGAGAYWWHENMGWEEVRIPRPMSGEAARNDLLAAERLVTALGGSAQAQFGFKQLPPGDPHKAVLVFPTQRRTLTPRQRQQMLDWVQSGGHLVVVTYSLAGEESAPDRMLESLGVRQYLNQTSKSPRKPPGLKSSPDLSPRPQPSTPRAPRRLPYFSREDVKCPAQRESGPLAPRFTVEGTTRAMLNVCFDPLFRLESRGESLWEVKGAGGAHALSVAHGKGEVTILTDYDFMTNRSIGKADHADFFLALIGFAPGTTVWFIPREEVPGIAALTWQHAWPVAVVLAIWLGALLWYAGWRFGPLQPAPETARRSIEEHLRANGEFLWRHGESIKLWQSALDEVRRRMEHTLPHLQLKSAPEQLQLLADKTGLGVARLQQAFYPQANPSANTFMHAISTLEHVRKHL